MTTNERAVLLDLAAAVGSIMRSLSLADAAICELLADDLPPRPPRRRTLRLVPSPATPRQLPVPGDQRR